MAEIVTRKYLKIPAGVRVEINHLFLAEPTNSMSHILVGLPEGVETVERRYIVCDDIDPRTGERAEVEVNKDGQVWRWRKVLSDTTEFPYWNPAIKVAANNLLLADGPWYSTKEACIAANEQKGKGFEIPQDVRDTMGIIKVIDRMTASLMELRQRVLERKAADDDKR